MPIKESAKKALRKSTKHENKNKQILNNIDLISRQFIASVENKEADKAKTLLTSAIKAIDKAEQRNILKQNTAARKKSILMRTKASK